MSKLFQILKKGGAVFTICAPGRVVVACGFKFLEPKQAMQLKKVWERDIQVGYRLCTNLSELLVINQNYRDDLRI